MKESESSKTILVIEDSRTTAMIYNGFLSRDYVLVHAYDGKSALDSFRQGGVQLVLLDLTLPDISGLTVLEYIRALDKHIPIIIVSSDNSASQIKQALNLGANDYVTKPVDRTRLLVTVSNAMKEFQLTKIVSQLSNSGTVHKLHNMVGCSQASHQVFHLIRSAAATQASVFITGESGVGKEVCAEAIHLESERRSKKFVAINCAAIPHDLLESEIFGHLKGSFTGATKDREGAAARADGGTLFLDELGEMPIDLQSKLLRFIQSQSYTPIGGTGEVKVDIRFICATNREPQSAIRDHLLREDLFYRLNVISISIPPLRERKADIIPLAKHFLRIISRDENKSISRLSPAVETVFASYSWPGNIRELQNLLRTLIVLNDGPEIAPSMLPRYLFETTPTENVSSVAETPTEKDQVANHSLSDNQEMLIQPLRVHERRIIENTINHFNGNIKKAATALELNVSTIYRKLEKWR